MPENKDLKRLVRERMAATGERYTEALEQLLARAPLAPLPGWTLMGDRGVDASVPVTSPNARPLPNAPQNLDFAPSS